MTNISTDFVDLFSVRFNVTLSKMAKFTKFWSSDAKILIVKGPFLADPSLSVVVRRQQFHSNNISSLTTGPIVTKLCRNDPWMVPFQSCSKN